MSNEMEKINPYFIGYNILTISLKENDFYNSISKALYITKIFTSSENTFLYKLKKDELYHCFNNNLSSQNIDNISHIVNANANKLDNDYLVINQEKKDHHLIIIPIICDNNQYVLTLSNPLIAKEKENIYVEVLKKSFSTILSKMTLYQDIKEKSEKDALTNIDNRLVYNETIEYLKDNPNIPFSFAILDLFRLKYINDNFGYAIGDIYIKTGAEIIKSFFPKYRLLKDDNDNLKKIYTGDQIFRIGGDEFVIISTSKTKEQLKYLIENYVNKVKIELPIKEEVPLHLNYGVSERVNKETIKTVFDSANILLSNNKRQMYQNYGIERRR